MKNEVTIKILDEVGSFAENKDKARDIRVNEIDPALTAAKNVILYFAGVTGTTQSFIHALISQLIRDYTPDVLESIEFKHCSQEVQGIITIVVDYMQQVD
jgi:hypothetical protein